MTTKTLSRKTLSIGAAVIVAVLLGLAFWPDPVMVDMGAVTQGPMQLSVEEQGYTEVTELYTVSAPLAGRLQRVELKAGDVVGQHTIVAQMLPSITGSAGTAQGQARLQAARTAVDAAAIAVTQAIADSELAQQQAKRSQQQLQLGTLSAAQAEQAQRDAIQASTAVDSAKARHAMRRAELSQLTSSLAGDHADLRTENMLNIPAPVSGQVLRVIQQNETELAAGAAILEIGNITDNLEVVVELLSSDAVRVKTGQRVLIRNWGGDDTLQGWVSRVDPLGFVKVSALGVEERRVKTTIKVQDLPASAAGLGHGFRVDVAIIIWEKSQTTLVPASALFRYGSRWAVFVVEDDTALQRYVDVEQNNGTVASVTEGLTAADKVILYPAAELADGTAVAQRKGAL